MSSDDECPRTAELVGLLGPRDLDPATAAELRRHIAGCAACAEELRLLEETFSAIAPAPAPEVMGRIEAAVLRVVAADLAPAGQRDAPGRAAEGQADTPGRTPDGQGAAPAGARTGRGRLGICGAAVMAWALGLGAALWQADGVPNLPLLPGVPLLLLAPVVLLSLSLGPRARRLALALSGIAAAALALGLARGVGEGPGGSGCVFLGMMGAVVPAGLLYGLLGKARRGALGGAALGLAAWCGGLSLQSVLCPGRWPLHVLVMHVLPAAAAVAACAGLGWLGGALRAKKIA